MRRIIKEKDDIKVSIFKGVGWFVFSLILGIGV